jgi:hypothetical protein
MKPLETKSVVLLHHLKALRLTVLTGMHLLMELWRELQRGDRRQGRGR